ncbi:GIY-YIG nuclease family protein [Phenylobacterium sp.]|uniref:GIY-YIG nuclease family protein n=1 Tax=Phenylobacterium sp. TaxID=1871053 RepID=UPI0035AD8DDB
MRDAKSPRGTPSQRYRRHLSRMPPDTAGDVYFVQARTLRLVKIGFAADAGDRLRTLRVGSPDELCLLGWIYSDDARRLEADIHVRFAAHRSHGEWFQPAPELLAFIRLSVVRTFGADRGVD